MTGPAIIPGQSSGAASDNIHTIESADVNTARELFKKASARLLNVNHWHEITGAGTAEFRLTDADGTTVERPARLGDLFCIDIPGPGNASGDGNDWVRVEAVEQHHEGEHELIAMRVRPCAAPGRGKNEVSHFFDEDATSTFCISREEKKVTAAVVGRNEKPNTDTSSILDKIRNLFVGGGAMAGLNKPQWKRLVKALLG